MYQAIGIAILFNPKVTDLIIDRNKSLEVDHQPIDLGEGAVPHLTLAQVCMSDEEIDVLQQTIADTTISAFDIASRGVEVIRASTHSYTRRNIELHDKLQKLHNWVMGFVYEGEREVRREYFLRSECISQGQIDRVADFPTTHAYKNYDPHITIGQGEHSMVPDLPESITTYSLVIGRLGNNGTLREIVYEKQF